MAGKFENFPAIFLPAENIFVPQNPLISALKLYFFTVTEIIFTDGINMS